MLFCNIEELQSVHAILLKQLDEKPHTIGETFLRLTDFLKVRPACAAAELSEDPVGRCIRCTAPTTPLPSRSCRSWATATRSRCAVPRARARARSWRPRWLARRCT